MQHTNHLLDLTVITSRQGKAMSYAITYSRAYVGVEAPLVSVETHLSSGLPALTIVGLNNPHDFTKPEPNENN
jgi:hypothetical protein